MKRQKPLRFTYADGIPHGTLAGYREHRRRIHASGDIIFTPCDACRWTASLRKPLHGVRVRHNDDGSCTVTWHYPWEARMILTAYVEGA